MAPVKLVEVTLIYAHRGLHGRERENTTAAFVAALELGAHGVELDVRRTVEGVVVVHHDATVEGRRVALTPRRRLPSYVPTLSEVLRASGESAVNVELKNSPDEPEEYDATGRFVHDVVETVLAAGAGARVLFSCFDRSTCLQLRVLDASLRVGWLLERRAPIASSLEWASEVNLDAVHPHVSTTSLGVVARAHELGLGVNVWTVNSRRDLRAMVELAVDGVITDRPQRALGLVAGSRR